MQNILRGRKLTASRGGTFIVGVIAAVVAAVVLVVYINHYRNRVKADVAPTPVLVASSLIPKGTSGTLVAEKTTMYVKQSVPKSQIKTGAITDPNYLVGRVAVTDILPNTQITAAEFSLATTNSIQSRLTKGQRAISLPVSGPQGLVGTVQSGDHVDIYLQAGALLALIEPNVLVLQAPAANTSSTGAFSNIGGQSNNGIILRVTSKQAAELAFASGNGDLWFVLRPTVGAQKTAPLTITLQSLLANRKQG